MQVAFFRYDVELTPERNPRGTQDRFREELRAWFVARELDYSMGSMGGPHCYGVVGHTESASETDRQAMATWLLGQRIHATVRLGAIEREHPPNLLAPIVDRVFEVDNLTDADRTEAAEYHLEQRRRFESLLAKRVKNGD